ncbi:unnamed protein product, partial [Polarella glacialis]
HLSCEELPDWDQSRYEMIRIVQLAEDSQHAQIELHFDKVLSTEVAVKRFSRERLCSSPEEFRARWGAEDLEDPWQEIYVASYLGQVGPSRVPGVLPCYGAFCDRDPGGNGDALLVSEWIASGDLFTFASDLGPPGPAREAKAIEVLLSLLKAVRGLHGLGVAHGDVSCENAMIRHEGDSWE